MILENGNEEMFKRAFIICLEGCEEYWMWLYNRDTWHNLSWDFHHAPTVTGELWQIRAWQRAHGEPWEGKRQYDT